MSRHYRLCPLCRCRLVAGWPHGRPYTTQDGRRMVLIVWRHRAGRWHREDCTATWPEEKAKEQTNLVIRE